MAANLGTASVRSALRKVLPYLVQAKDQNLNEADTVERVVKMLTDVLGYDGMTEVTHESNIKGKYVDLAVKLDGVTKFLVEVKSAGTTLRDRHTDQARSYAAEGNIPWVVLTNCTDWYLYHLTFDEGIDHERVFEIDLSGEHAATAYEKLALLHRDSIRKNVLQEFWRRHSALSPASLGRALFTESVIRILRRNIRKSEGILIDEEDLVTGLKELFSADAREQIGPIRIHRQRKKRDKNSEAALKPSPSEAEEVTEPNGDS